jgi:hypothetical protein
MLQQFPRRFDGRRADSHGANRFVIVCSFVANRAGDCFTSVYRCFTAKGEETIPLFGHFGLANPIGPTDYSAAETAPSEGRKWLDSIRALRPHCPARISGDGQAIVLNRSLRVFRQERGSATLGGEAALRRCESHPRGNPFFRMPCLMTVPLSRRSSPAKRRDRIPLR